MYEIVNFETGESVGITERPTYIRLASNGCYVMCSEKDMTNPNKKPQGVAYASTPYNLYGAESMGDLPTVIVREIDVGGNIATIPELVKKSEDLKTENESLSTQLTDSQLALCDVYEQLVNSEQQVTETQLALCDVYEQLIALTTQTEGGEPT